MAVKIGHASIDEHGKARGGAAGDQTGREVFTRSWYPKGWVCVIRPKRREIAEKIAIAMEQACANDKIGYDQGQRTTLFAEAQKCGWNLSRINTPCETDCSALVSVCVNAAGIKVSKDIYTGNEKSVLNATGEFEIITSARYLNSDTYLKRGDILLSNGHTAIVLSDGSGAETDSNSKKPKAPAVAKAEPAKNHDKALAGQYRATVSGLNIRAGAGTYKASIGTVPAGEVVRCYGYYTQSGNTKWLYIQYKDITGFCSGGYLEKV